MKARLAALALLSLLLAASPSPPAWAQDTDDDMLSEDVEDDADTDTDSDGDDGGDDGDDGDDADDGGADDDGATESGEIDTATSEQEGNADEGREFEEDEILADDPDGSVLARAESLGFKLQERLDLDRVQLRLLRLTPPAGQTVSAALDRLRAADPAGAYARNDHYRLASSSATPDCSGVRCYGQDLVGVPPACGQAPRIALLDTAVDARHPALRGRLLNQVRIGGGEPSPAAHGTAVALLLAGAAPGRGLLPQAQLLAADVFRADAGGAVAEAARLLQGLDWALAQQPDAINLSFTGPDSPLLRKAVQRAAAQGVPLIAAAGNEGPRAAPQFPAAYPEVLAVTAVDRRLKPWARAAQGPHVGLSAPGVAVWSDERFHDGSSFASPFVTAAAALLKQQEPKASVAQIQAQLRGRARDLGAPGADPVFGAGLLQWPACSRN